MSVTKYMYKFDEFLVQRLTIPRFLNGLKPELKGEVFTHSLDSAEYVF